jgi:hypothetical protein
LGKQKYDVNLSEQEIKQLTKIIHTGKSSAREILHANILLAVDGKKITKLSHAKIAAMYQTSAVTVQKIINAYAISGLTAALQRKKRVTPPVPAKVDGVFEAHVIALCCSKPPKGYARWSVRLLSEKCVELQYIDSVSHMTISRTLKKLNLNLI